MSQSVRPRATSHQALAALAAVAALRYVPFAYLKRERPADRLARLRRDSRLLIADGLRA